MLTEELIHLVESEIDKGTSIDEIARLLRERGFEVVFAQDFVEYTANVLSESTTRE